METTNIEYIGATIDIIQGLKNLNEINIAVQNVVTL
jgi:hypothetical protein